MKVFIDCGTNLGQGLLELNKKYSLQENNEEWEIHTFEPNPDIELNFDKFNNVTIHKKAVWINNETISFARSLRKNQYDPDEGKGAKGNPGEMTSVGCRIKNDHIQNIDMKGNTLNNFVEVDGIDFAQFLQKFEDYDKVVVKMDIEGAEYDVLRHLINQNVVHIIDDLYVEFHEWFVKGESKQTNKDLVQNLKNNYSINIEEWD